MKIVVLYWLGTGLVTALWCGSLGALVHHRDVDTVAHRRLVYLWWLVTVFLYPAYFAVSAGGLMAGFRPGRHEEIAFLWAFASMFSFAVTMVGIYWIGSAPERYRGRSVKIFVCAYLLPLAVLLMGRLIDGT